MVGPGLHQKVWILLGLCVFLQLFAFLVCDTFVLLEFFWMLYFFGFLVEVTLAFPVFFHVQFSCCLSVGFAKVMDPFS
jgi:hypothetical protein